MPLSAKLDKKLRAAVEDDSDGLEYYEVSDRSSPSIIDTGDGAELLTGSEDEEEEDVSEEDDEDQVQQRLSKVSFGALAKAQESLTKENKKRKRGDETSEPQEDKLQALRERLRLLKAEKFANQDAPNKKAKTSAKSKPARRDHNDSDDSSDDGGRPKARSSKHAPAVQSSKKAVTRKREAVEVKKVASRDPRFDNVAGPKPDENTMKKRYGFLNDYKDSEIADLRTALKKSKDEGEKEKMKKLLLSMESQKKARVRKEKEQQVIAEHKKKEKEAVKEGKQPFYLKKSEQKKIALVDRFQNMKAKEREHVLERRRKKVASKEKKSMPADRRERPRF